MTLPGRIAVALAMLFGEVEAAPYCSGEEVANARAAASGLRDWEAMYDAFHRFSQCETAEVSAAFSASIAYLLTTGWSELHDLEHFAEANRGFRAFVVMHIDTSVGEAELRQILRNTAHCPGYARPICRQIEYHARAALRCASGRRNEADC